METITIEVRPRLRSCNIFISTIVILDKSAIQLKLSESVLTLGIGGQTKYLLLAPIKIIPKTLSSLTVVNNWISLRVQTQPIESTHGSFKTELLGAVVPKRVNSASENNELCMKQKSCVLRCSRCKHDISEVAFFNRVLPLPSNNTDPSEWFCCNHNGDGYSTLPEPKETDCFYEKDYRVFSKAIFKKDSKIDGQNQTMTCNRCLAELGVYVSSSGSVKIWNCCVDYRFLDNSLDVVQASHPLKDFASIVNGRTDIFTGNRLLVEASEGDRSHYLLLQVMDQSLELLAEKDCCKSNNVDTIELTSSPVTKLLYKYAENEAEMKGYCLDIERCRIALPVMLAAINHLTSTTKRYPPSYRIVDKYLVGYIDV